VELQFTKMTGAGNDFVLIDDRKTSLNLDWGTLAPRLCDRRYGIGADGLLVLEASNDADFGMKYYNADGSYGGMCGNGGRCAARFVMDEAGLSIARFDALGFTYRAHHVGQFIELHMKDPISLRKDILHVGSHKIPYVFIDTGTAHAVIFVGDLEPVLAQMAASGEIQHIGSEIRNHAAFAPGGTNVNFVRVLDDGTLAMRTYERGVEAETLACGTGAIASAIVSHLYKQTPVPTRVRTRSKEILEVGFKKEGNSIREVTLTGSADMVYSGKIAL